MSDLPERRRSIEPVPVRRIAAGHYATKDKRFELIDLGWGKYRWEPRTDWDAEPVACAWLDSGESAWLTLRGLRLRLAEVYADEALRRTGPSTALETLLGGLAEDDDAQR